VTVVTTFAVLSPVSDETLEGEMLRAHLHQAGVRVAHATTITQIAPGPVGGHRGPWLVQGRDRYGDPWSAGCDGVVLVTQQASDDRLYLELAGDPAALAAAGIGAVHRIGDAVAPRLLSETIFDGHRLAREIDSPDPATPLPYRREPADLG
jgi:dimethylamine/trimethylamine dehydrogenase